MIGMHNNQSEWQYHMYDDHENEDMHYGGFNMINHTFEYTFRMMDGESSYKIMFKGIKN